MKAPCTYCGYDVDVPDDFIPEDRGGMVLEKFDEASGAMLLVSEQLMLQCRTCRISAMVGSKVAKPKGVTREQNAKKKIKPKAEEKAE
jgi:hypothetical protein